MKTFLLFLTFLFANTLTAQQRQSVFFEMGGGSGLSLNYDRRLAPESPWGVRAGLGFGFTLINGEMLDRAVVLPLGAYRLVGNHRHSLELGAGMTLGMGWETVKPPSVPLWADTARGGPPRRVTPNHTPSPFSTPPSATVCNPDVDLRSAQASPLYCRCSTKTAMHWTWYLTLVLATLFDSLTTSILFGYENIFISDCPAFCGHCFGTKTKYLC